MDRSPPFRVYCQRLDALFGLAFAAPSCRKHLSLPETITPGPIMQKVRRHPTKGLRQLVSIRFQVLLTPLTGVLFTVPLRYYALSVDEEYLALRRGRRRFTRGFTCPVLLRILLGFRQISVTGVSPSLPALSRAFSYPLKCHNGVLQPRRNKFLRFGLIPVRSPLLRESRSLSIPPLTEMFHFSGFASHTYLIQCGIVPCYRPWVVPFGNPRIKACLPLPEAYRSFATSFLASHRQGIHLMLLEA